MLTSQVRSAINRAAHAHGKAAGDRMRDEMLASIEVAKANGSSEAELLALVESIAACLAAAT